MERLKGMIVCDQCHAEFETQEIELKDRVIGRDEDNNDVTERYFECPFCGEHYTVTVIDRKQRLMIQESNMLKRRWNREIRIGNGQKARKYAEKAENLKTDIIARSKYLKRKYMEDQTWDI